MKNNVLFIILSLVFLTALPSAYALGETDMRLADPRCEYQENPTGLDELAPRLSWQLHSIARGQVQTAYRILVASSPEKLQADQGDLWDTGKQSSDVSTGVVYQGLPLRSRMQCYWKAMAWDADDQPTAWSPSASWSMGLLEPKQWQATWIGKHDAGVDPNEFNADSFDASLLSKANWVWHGGSQTLEVPPGTRYFRCKFDLDDEQQPVSAALCITADDYLCLWVNGHRVGEKHGHTTAQTYHVEPWLHKGTNTIAVLVSNAGSEPNPAGLLGLLALSMHDGSQRVIATDQDWESAEHVDEGWEDAEADKADWQPVKVLGPSGMSPWGDTQLSGRRRLPAVYLRKETALPKRVAHAMAYISGLGYYQLFINGKRIGDHELDPILRDYSKQTPYVTYDVTDSLQEGNNAIGVSLGCGRYYAPHPRTPMQTRDFGLPSLLLQVEVEYEDGTQDTIISDQTWRVTDDGPIRNNNDYDGEYYDARKALGPWTDIGYDADTWDSADAMDPPAGRLGSASLVQPMRVTEHVKPVAITQPAAGVYVFDFGQNFVGRCTLRVQGPKGTAVRLRFSENLYPDGTIDVRNLRAAECTDTYVLHGSGEEVYTPSFTYHGFRYVEVSGYPGMPSLESLLGQVIHTDMPFAGDFDCSQPVINQIVRNARWGIRGNYLSIPTDCPQRDERHGWLGDRAAEQLGESYLFENLLLYEKWMGDIRDAQNDEGIIPDVAPNYWRLYSGNVTWPAAFVIIPGNLHRHYGDIRTIERCYPALQRWMAYLHQQLDGSGTLERDQYGDWCCPPESEELIHSQQEWRKTPARLLSTSYYYHCLKLMERYAGLLGKDDDAQGYAEQAKIIYAGFNRELFDESRGYYGNGSQTSQVLPLAFGLVPEDRHAQVVDYLTEHIRTRTDSHIGTGLIGGQWLLRTLSDNGHIDVAYRLATNTDYPSWGYMIENGATTIWELWNGDTANPGMNSGNHVMLLGDLVIWFYENLAGIKSDPDRPGFKHIIMKPHPMKDLAFVNANYKSLYGTVSSRWRVDENIFTWDIEVPVNTTATVYIPATSADSVIESGKLISSSTHNKRIGLSTGRLISDADSNDIQCVGIEHGRLVCRIGSGVYHFESKLGNRDQ